METLYHQ